MIRKFLPIIPILNQVQLRIKLEQMEKNIMKKMKMKKKKIKMKTHIQLISKKN